MLTVALTGGMATGKTHVLQGFARRGVPAIDADGLARDVVRPGEPAWRAIQARFGPSVFATDGTIDRASLARVAFGDPAARRDLEAIVHPPVYAAIRQWRTALEAAGASSVAMVDIPLLFETGHADDFDRVIVTTCTLTAQLARIAARDGLAEEAARQRIDAQWSSDAKASRADYVIDTNGTMAETDRQVTDVFQRLLRDAAVAG